MIEAAKITIVLISENKKYVGRLKHSNKRRSKKCYVLIKKRRIKGEKYITRVDFAEHLRKLYVSENNKFCYGRFLRNGLCETYCYISKSR